MNRFTNTTWKKNIFQGENEESYRNKEVLKIKAQHPCCKFELTFENASSGFSIYFEKSCFYRCEFALSKCTQLCNFAQNQFT